jgi:hypothetical protein
MNADTRPGNVGLMNGDAPGNLGPMNADAPGNLGPMKFRGR